MSSIGNAVLDQIAAGPISADMARRIRGAIEDCNRFIAKEEPRAAHLRPADVAKHLEFCKAHRAKLLGMLKDAA